MFNLNLILTRVVNFALVLYIERACLKVNEPAAGFVQIDQARMIGVCKEDGASIYTAARTRGKLTPLQGQRNVSIFEWTPGLAGYRWQTRIYGHNHKQNPHSN